MKVWQLDKDGLRITRNGEMLARLSANLSVPGTWTLYGCGEMGQYTTCGSNMVMLFERFKQAWKARNKPPDPRVYGPRKV